MKEIIKNYYYLASGITGTKKTAYYIAIFVVAMLCLVSLSGIALLVRDIMPSKSLLIAFKFPFYILTGAVLYFILLKAYPSERIAYKNPNKRSNMMLVVLSLAIAIALYSYSWFVRIPDVVPYQ